MFTKVLTTDINDKLLFWSSVTEQSTANIDTIWFTFRGAALGTPKCKPNMYMGFASGLPKCFTASGLISACYLVWADFEP